MPTTSRIAEVAFWIGIVLWISALVTAGVSAAMAFPTMHEFEVVVPKFAAYDESQHWSIAAGLLMERIFWVTDLAQMFAALLVIIGLGAGYGTSGRRFKQPLEMMRTVCVLAAVALLAYRVLILAPSMNGSLQRYWHAAEHGNTELAVRHRTDFQALHPIASRVYGVMLVLLLGAVATTAWTPAAPAHPHRPTPGEPVEPELVKKARR